MAKNEYLKKLQIQKAVEMREQRLHTIAFCADAAILAANEIFQRKGKKLVEFFEAYVKYAHEIAEMTIEDAKGDKSLEYTKTKVDERLKELLGEDFTPWEVRHHH